MKLTRWVLVLALMTSVAPALANDAESKASEAVANVIFDYDGSNEFLSYHVREDGFVDAVFASNTPDALYTDIVEKLRSHKDIKGVLAGRGGPTCSRF
jgi:hypothetical protein